ncbi:MAG: restriction endonuclease subunit S, partial [Flavobacteriales bacterium]
MRENWSDIEFSDAVVKISTNRIKTKQKDYLPSGEIAIVDQGQELIGGYTNDTSKSIPCQLPVVVFGDHTKAIKHINFQFAPGADGTKVLQPKQFVDSKLLYYFTEVLVLLMEDKGYARHYQHVEKSTFPLPPLPEQRSIVGKLEQLFSELDSGIGELQRAQAKLKVYRQAVLKKAFEGELTKEWRAQQKDLPTAEALLEQIKEERSRHYEQQLSEWKAAVKDWEKKGKVGKKPSKTTKPKELAPPTKAEIELYGALPNSWEWTRYCSVTYKIGDIDHKMPRPYENGIPYLSTGNIGKDGTLDFDSAKRISPDDYKRLALKIKPEKGDIIFPRYGTIGRNILVNVDREFLVSYACAILKTIPDVMSELYCFYHSLSPVTSMEIRRYTVDTVQANVGIASIESFMFPLCPIEEQQQIVEAIESRLSVCDKVEESIATNLQKAEALRQSILKKA